MKNHAMHRPLRMFITILFLLSSTVAFWSGLFVLGYWDDLWREPVYQNSSYCYDTLYSYRYRVQDLLEFDWQTDKYGATYGQKKNTEALREQLLSTNTNFRFQVHDSAGNLLMDNLNGAVLEDTVVTVHQSDGQVNPSYTAEDDYFTQNVIQGQEHARILCVTTSDGSTRMFDPETMTIAELLEAEQYGWVWVQNEPPAEAVSDELGNPDFSYYNSDGFWTRDGEDIRDQDGLVYTIEYGLPAELTVDDPFLQQAQNYQELIMGAQALRPIFALFLLLTVALLCLLLRAAGWQKGSDTVVLRSRDHWWYELYAAATAGIFCLALSLGDSISLANQDITQFTPEATIALALFTLLVVWVIYLTLETTAVRLKAHVFWHTTFCGRLWHWLKRILHALYLAFCAIPLYGRAVCLFLLYLVGTLLSAMTLFLIPLYQGAALYLICRWIKQWRTIRAATHQVAEGNVNCQIDTDKMYHDLREHAEELNRLSDGLNKAVNERMKSEHFKSELITNVSHDLKTPLTSIINYVDLLKKTDVQDPKALEYIDVLDRKSQRLKKLTEDLVEASKASTGTLTVNRERLNVSQLADQALAEYTDRLTACGLTPVMTLPEEAAYVSADGRHLWRVIDNLLSNCCKYAMPGTRIYLDVARWDGQVLLSVKNISREPLNMSADALMERFVRGDVSRTTEGSGLGLSIARSLTELQDGSFRLSIDGDLFKAVVTFPEAPTVPSAPDR